MNNQQKKITWDITVHTPLIMWITGCIFIILYCLSWIFLMDTDNRDGESSYARYKIVNNH